MSTPPRYEPPASTERLPDEPATVEDLRGLRRWLWVVGVWAAAASVIALIALIDSGDGDGDRAATTQSEIAALEERLNGRLDNIEQALDERASTRDVQRLSRRVVRAEEQVTDAADAGTEAADDLKQVQEDVDDLQRRVEELEAGPPASDESP